MERIRFVTPGRSNMEKVLVLILMAANPVQTLRDIESTLQTLDKQFLELKGREAVQVRCHILYICVAQLQ